jgi:hypothetical protein
MKKLIPILVLVAFLWSCEQGKTEKVDDNTNVENTTGEEMTAGNSSEEEAEEAEEVFPDPDAVGNFGAAVSAEGAMEVAQLPKQIGTQDSLRIKLAGEIKSACQAKGCWMTLPLEGDEELMVKFKDYAFFVPKNSAGKKAVIDGWAYRELVSVDELRHYAEDEGLAKEEVEKITEPEERLTFMADGVIIEE